ncbi:MAG: nitroreductase family deazaflavin-dependent oxidoreductase [Kouleothrix sp.]|nr:nitroreductase family deazaflavin-dependent oxidoreductase [Kouleothrix sp.]
MQDDSRSEPTTRRTERGRRVLRAINRTLMVPIFRLRLGWLVANPLSGYIMVLKTIGRRSGQARYAPLNYAILGDYVYCAAGWGAASHWYRNLVAHPQVECLLPGRAVSGVAEPVTDPDEAARAVRRLLQSAGFAGFSMGFNPHTATDELLRERTAHLPVVRIRVEGLRSGPADPGGWLWVAALAGQAVPIAWLLGRRGRDGGAR